jgi:hypothetical protein
VFVLFLLAVLTLLTCGVWWIEEHTELPAEDAS